MEVNSYCKLLGNNYLLVYQNKMYQNNCEILQCVVVTVIHIFKYTGLVCSPCISLEHNHMCCRINIIFVSHVS